MSAPLLVLLGLLGLIIGGEFLVRGAVSAAKAFGISPMVIGLTLVGFGTSSPELVTSLQAALSGSSGMAMGNVIGSNIGNVLLILGIAALIAPVAVDPKVLRRDGVVMLLAAFLCLGTVLLGEVGRVTGAVLVAGLVAYLAVTLWVETRGAATPTAAVYGAEAEAVPGPDYALGVSIALAVFGLASTIFGARFLVTGAVSIAEAAGVSVVYAIVVGVFIYRDLKPRDVPAVLGKAMIKVMIGTGEACRPLVLNDWMDVVVVDEVVVLLSSSIPTRASRSPKVSTMYAAFTACSYANGKSISLKEVQA